jgi:hypothetical protein
MLRIEARGIESEDTVRVISDMELTGWWTRRFTQGKMVLPMQL